MALDWQRKNCAFETIELSGRTGKQLTNTQRVKRILLRMPTIRIIKKKKSDNTISEDKWNKDNICGKKGQGTTLPHPGKEPRKVPCRKVQPTQIPCKLK